MIEKAILTDKLDKVLNQLLQLKSPEIDNNLLKDSDAGESVGIYPKDFGMGWWDWPQGVGLYGLIRYNLIKNDEKYSNYISQWYLEHIKKGLPSRNINTTAPLLTLVDVCDQNKEFESLCLDWANWIMNDLPRTKENGFQHITSTQTGNGVKLNEEQIWIDTLFMTVLFLNKMGNKYNKNTWVDESLNQVLTHIKYLYDKKTGLFHHGWSFIENGNFGEVFWCRGNSWFTLGIVDYLDMFNENINEGLKKFIQDTYKAQVDGLIKLQNKDGLWHTVLDDDTSYVEVSGSAAIAAGILKGVRLRFIDESYRKYGLKAIEGVLNNIGADGTVLNVSCGTSIGYNKDHYKNIITGPMAYGQSLAIIALVESLYHI